MKKQKLHKNIVVAFCRILEGGGILSRQSSLSDSSQKMGGGYLYYTPKTNQQIGPTAARFLIEKEIVKPISDGLFEGHPQSYQAISRAEFVDFKERYEQVPLRER